LPQNSILRKIKQIAKKNILRVAVVPKPELIIIIIIINNLLTNSITV